MMETFNKLETPKIKGCQKHSNQPLSFFCQECLTDICRDCIVLDHKEADGHIIQDITLAEVQQCGQPRADSSRRYSTLRWR